MEHPLITTEVSAWEEVANRFRLKPKDNEQGICEVLELLKDDGLDDSIYTAMYHRLNRYREANDIITLFFWPLKEQGHKERVRLCELFIRMCKGEKVDYIDPAYSAQSYLD